MDFFSDDVRRDPFRFYAMARAHSPVLRVPPPFDAWAVLDYAGVKRVLTDHEAFSSRVPAPKHWFIFSDPPGHTKLRALVSKAFTPRVVTHLEPRIRELSAGLLDAVAGRGEMDLAADYAVPLPMMVIAEMIGIPSADWPRFRRWSDVILKLSYTRSGGDEAERALEDFIAVTDEMGDYLKQMTARLRVAPADDLLSRLLVAEVDGQHLTHEEILGFFQLLIVAGQETTANLINNAVICFLENPDQAALLRARPELLPSGIEEVLRYRSPFQWIMRTPGALIEMHGQTLRPGELVLAMVGSANRDPAVFADADRFDITRDPNPHLAFGHGIHFCMGAPLSRLEARIALTDLLGGRLRDLRLATGEPWEPRKALHVHGPQRLPVRFTPAG
jgi:cytochrome P450